MKHTNKTILILTIPLFLIGCTGSEIIGGGLAAGTAFSIFNDTKHSVRQPPKKIATLQSQNVPTSSISNFERMQEIKSLENGVDLYEKGEYQKSFVTLYRIDHTLLSKDEKRKLFLYLIFTAKLNDDEQSVNQWMKIAHAESPDLDKSVYLSNFHIRHQKWFLDMWKSI